MNSTKNELCSGQKEEVLKTLKTRFEKNLNHPKGLEWTTVQAKLKANTEKLWSLNEMESTGGEPDIVDQDKKTDEYLFYDCSAGSPKGRRSLCYDREGLESRKEFKPVNTASVQPCFRVSQNGAESYYAHQGVSWLAGLYHAQTAKFKSAA